MSIGSAVFQLVGLAVDAAGIGVSSLNHNKTLETEKELHKDELKEIHKQHAEVLMFIQVK